MMRGTVMLFLAAGASLVRGTISAGAQPVPDHLKCYKVKDPAPRASYTADLGGLVAEPGCTIRVPATMACVPATKTNVNPTPPGGGGSGTPNSFFCYKVRCPRAALPTLTGADQFGSRTVMPSVAKLLCAPLAGVYTTTTITSSTTTTTVMTRCPLPATGQTTCWDSNGNAISCAGTGQDGDLRKGAPLSYTDNGDGTIIDNNTELVWEKQSNGDGSIHDFTNLYTWDQAFSMHVATLNSASFAGHNDWRLPNLRELQSIVNSENFLPAVSAAFNTGCAPGCAVTICSCTQGGIYWSSSTYAGTRAAAWGVHFENGIGTPYKTESHYVRAVRGGP
jgi:hypothetical protein